MCDRRPADAIAFAFVEPDGSTADLSFGELRDRSRRFAGLSVAAFGARSWSVTSDEPAAFSSRSTRRDALLPGDHHGIPTVSSTIAATVTGCGRPRCCHDLRRARPPDGDG
jgi:hypothetical protein